MTSDRLSPVRTPSLSQGQPRIPSVSFAHPGTHLAPLPLPPPQHTHPSLLHHPPALPPQHSLHHGTLPAYAGPAPLTYPFPPPQHVHVEGGYGPGLARPPLLGPTHLLGPHGGSERAHAEHPDEAEARRLHLAPRPTAIRPWEAHEVEGIIRWWESPFNLHLYSRVSKKRSYESMARLASLNGGRSIKQISNKCGEIERKFKEAAAWLEDFAPTTDLSKREIQPSDPPSRPTGAGARSTTPPPAATAAAAPTATGWESDPAHSGQEEERRFKRPRELLQEAPAEAETEPHLDTLPPHDQDADPARWAALLDRERLQLERERFDYERVEREKDRAELRAERARDREERRLEQQHYWAERHKERLHERDMILLRYALQTGQKAPSSPLPPSSPSPLDEATP